MKLNSNVIIAIFLVACVMCSTACTTNVDATDVDNTDVNDSTDSDDESDESTDEDNTDGDNTDDDTEEFPTTLAIVEAISAHRPSVTGAPSNLRSMLGATHVNGQYYLTDEPYLVEGARKLNQLGYGLLKLWFYKADGQAHGYKYNSPDWNLTEDMTLKELAQHKYYVEAFDMPFEVFCLNINDGWPGNSTEDLGEEYARVEEEFYDLTTYLLATYSARDIKFILSNWEGDWLLRGGETWSTTYVADDWELRVNNMIAWENARQAGVDRARQDFGEVACKVYNVVEVNKVYDGVERGIPSVTTHVLPNVRVDMVSWSAYDGKDDTGVDMYKGILYLRNYINPSDYMNGERIAYIGEINEHENATGRTEESVKEFCDLMMGVYLALDVPYVFYWELYGNDVVDGLEKDQSTILGFDDLTGNWIVRPDGTLGWAGEYFDGLFQQVASQGDASGDVSLGGFEYNDSTW